MIVGKLMALVQGNQLRAQLIRSSLGSILIKVSGAGLGFFVTVLLSRMLSPEEYGVYSYVFAIVSFLVIPAKFGIPTLVVRETARARLEESCERIRGILKWSTLAVILSTLVLMSLAGVAAWIWIDQFTASQVATFWWGMVMIPLLALGAIRGGALRGMGKIVSGQLPDLVLRPVFFIVFILVISFYLGADLTASEAMALHAFAAMLAFLIGVYILWRNMPSSTSQAKYESRSWFVSTLNLGLISGIEMLNSQTDILILGLFSSPTEVASYRISVQMMVIVLMSNEAIQAVLAPYVSRFYSEGDYFRLQKMITISARFTFAFAVIVVSLLVLFGRQVLPFVFGEHYLSSYMPMVVLCIGQLFSVFFGSLVTVANMTGHERSTARLMIIGALLNIALNFILIPKYGSMGAAAATTISLVTWRSALYFKVRRWVGLETSALGATVRK